MAGVGGTVGSVVGGAIGTAIAPGVGTAIGSALGGALGAYGASALTNQSVFDITSSETENARRLAELKRMREMGTLGLSAAEQNALFNAQQAQVQGRLGQAQQTMRASGAAGMASGAGAEQLRQLGLAETQAELGQMATALGIPADKAAGIFPFLQQNPDLMKYFAMAMGG